MRVLLHGSQAYAVGVLEPLARELGRRGIDAAWFFEGPGAEHLPEHARRIGSVREARAFGADLVLVSSDTVPHFVPGLKVAVFHGLDARKRPDARGHFRMRGYFDLYCTHGPTTTAPFRELAKLHGHFEVAETGFPKLDPAFVEGVARSSPRPVVLYAPTMTPELTSAPALLETIAGLATSGEWEWRVKLHAKMPSEIVQAYGRLEGPGLRVVEDPDLIRAMADADVMVSDTSSAPVEFVVTGRPAVTFRHREPGPWFVDVTEAAGLEPAIRTALAPPASLRAAMETYAATVHPYRDGAASVRVVDAALDLLERGTGHLRPKPLNLWRKAQARWRYGYWGPA